MEGLCASQPAQDHDLGCSRVHAPLLTPRAAFRSGPHPPVRLSGQPLPYSKPATVPRSAHCPPTTDASRFPRLRRYQPCRPHAVSYLQTRAFDTDRTPQPRTACDSGHFMTLSRDLSSSSFSIPSRDSADLCLGIATLHLQAFSAPLPSSFMLARKSPRPSCCAASGILGRAVTAKTPFNTQ